MLVVVGGHSRNIGKTSVVAGLIERLPEMDWTAIKITQFGHGICSSAGKPCGCSITCEHPFAIDRETAASGSDTGRFLGAGALQSYWVRTAVGQLGNSIPALRGIIAESRHTIIESNSLLQFVRPDLYLVVMDFSREDFKPSSLRFLDRADAILLLDSGINVPLWRGVAHGLWDRKKQFVIKPPQYVTPAIAAFVRERLSAVDSVDTVPRSR
jgi:hypothetical protein